MTKVIALDEKGETVGEFSQQMPVDPFGSSYQHSGLVKPPFPFEQLIFLAESHPTHAAVLDQKSADVVGTGWTWDEEASKADDVSDDDGEEGDKKRKKRRATTKQDADEKAKQELETWFRELGEGPESDETTHDLLLTVMNDLETVGHGIIELARDPSGKIRYWYSMPAHTTRFHKGGVKIAQIRDEKRVWFKRWRADDETEIDRVTGKIYKDGGCPPDRRANEVLVIKRPARRSSWYGIPAYVSSIGWIVLSNAARDDNIYFFENRREPRWAIVLTNIEDDPRIIEQLRKALQVDFKKPHKNLVIPLTGAAQIEFKQLGDNKGDMSWEKLQDRADASILLSHRTPGERIGLVRVGALGGSVVADTSRVYKETFVATTQRLLSSRITAFVREESGKSAAKQYKWMPEELDLTEEGAVQDMVVKGFGGGVYKLDEAREKLDLEELDADDPRGDKFLWELNPQAAAIAQGAAAAIAQGGGDPAMMGQAQQSLAEQIQQLIGSGANDPNNADGTFG